MKSRRGRGRYVDFEVGPNGLTMTPTAEGVEEAKEWLASNYQVNFQGTYALLEDWIGNGWSWVPPDGAITEAPIISSDDSKWEFFAFMQYTMKDCVEEWAAANSVFWPMAHGAPKGGT